MQKNKEATVGRNVRDRCSRHKSFSRRSLRLGVEPLEPRMLLASDASLAAPGFLTIDDVAEMLASQSITDATVVTHGFQFSESSGGDSLMSLAQAVRSRSDLENGEEAASWLLDYDLIEQDGRFIGQFDATQSILPPPGSAGPGHLVLLFDWARESNEMSSGWGDAAGDALFNLVVRLGLAAPAEKSAVPLHFIGHSFGTAVTSESVERLAAFNIPVDQVTYLDPHDFDQSLIPVDGDQQLFTLGRPNGYGATVWENVAFTDVLYQTDGILVIPNGRPIPGAYNRLVNDLVNGLNPHSEVWELYQTTIENPSTTEGYAYSRVVGATRPDIRSEANSAYRFFSTPASAQDHEYSPDPLTDLGVALSPAELNFFRAEPLWNPLSVSYGDFGSAESGSQFAGWLNHGGGDSGEIVCATNDCALQLESGKSDRTHNRLYVPKNALALVFDLQRVTISSDDRLVVHLADEELGSLALATTDNAMVTHALTIPETARNRSQTVSFSIVSDTGVIESVLRIDNVRLGAWQNPTLATDVSGDRLVVPNDVLLVINEINVPKVSALDGRLSAPPANRFGPPYYDVNGDGFVVPNDVLLIINQINRDLGEGESAVAIFAALDDFHASSDQSSTSLHSAKRLNHIEPQGAHGSHDETQRIKTDRGVQPPQSKRSAPRRSQELLRLLSQPIEVIDMTL